MMTAGGWVSGCRGLHRVRSPTKRGCLREGRAGRALKPEDAIRCKADTLFVHPEVRRALEAKRATRRAGADPWGCSRSIRRKAQTEMSVDPDDLVSLLTP